MSTFPFLFYPSPHFLFIISTPIQRFSTWPTPNSLHSHPDSPHFHPYSPHSHYSHLDSPRFYLDSPYSSHCHPNSPHFHHSPHSVSLFTVPAFKDSPIGQKKFLWLKKFKILCHGHALLMVLMVKKLMERFMKKSCKDKKSNQEKGG